GVLIEQTRESRDISALERGERLREAWMRYELGDLASNLDEVLERAPALVSVFAGDDQLGVGELERGIEHELGTRVLEAWMVCRDARGGDLAPVAMQCEQLFRLKLELRETRALGKRLRGHTRSFR